MTRRNRARPPENADILLFNKPYQVLSQFSGNPEQKTLADWVPFCDIYAAGRLDADSEGLLILTANGRLQSYIAHPKHKMTKTYWVQVEGIPSDEALNQLRAGVDIGDYVTERCEAQMIDAPTNLWPRNPPIRTRLSIPTSWIEIKIREGKNRQVRRMTAKIGYPTLRLIRAAIGPWQLEDMQPGQWRWVNWLDFMPPVAESPKRIIMPRHRRRYQNRNG